MTRRLFIDCTDSYLRPEVATGIQRVTRQLAARCRSQCPEGWEAFPVYYLHGMLCVARPGRLHRLLCFVRLCRKKVHVVFRHLYGQPSFARWLRLPLWLPARVAELVVTLGIQIVRSMLHLGNLPSRQRLRPGDILLHPEYPLGHISFVANARNHGVSIVPIIHDVLPLTHPHLFGCDPRVSAWFEWVADHAAAILCVSGATATAVRQVLSPRSPAVVPFQLGGDFLQAGDGAPILASPPTRPVFLMVGTVEPRKRHVDALVAFEQLWAGGADIALHIIGKPGWMTDSLAERMRSHPELGGRLIWSVDVSDGDLELAYRSAHAVIAASEAEGFGLPVVEALSRGTPVIASDIPVFHEVAGCFAEYFPMGDTDALAEVVRRSATNARQAVSGFRWPTWDDASRKALKLAAVLGTDSRSSVLE